jgi:hypothetical protein
MGLVVGKKPERLKRDPCPDWGKGDNVAETEGMRQGVFLGRNGKLPVPFRMKQESGLDLRIQESFQPRP